MFARLGLASTPNDNFWSALSGLHRGALYDFGSNDLDLFTVAHGFKEGDVTSPVAFIIVYSCIMHHFRQVKMETLGSLRGIELRSIPDEVVPKRVDLLKKLLHPNPNENITSIEIDTILFADDTTILEEIDDTGDAPVVNVYVDSINDGGMCENESKRSSGDVTQISTRNLGVDTNNR